MEYTNLTFGGQDHGNLIVLGNGFDLDLGFPTGYNDFVNNPGSPENGGFPFVRGGDDFHSLGRFNRDAINIKKWYDLENVLAEYGNQNPVVDDIDGDKEDYSNLISSLTLYLKAIDISHPSPDSVAARILKAVTECIIPPTVYTFNYTDLSLIGESLGISIGSEIHVHGSLADNNVILGVGDYAKLTESSDYLYKTSSEKYHSTNMLRELDTCDNILFFGLSLSPVDYPYFEDFFSKVAYGRYGHERRKYIRIFTYDNESRMEILRNLREMNRGHMITLSNYSDFDIIRVKDNMDEDKVDAVIRKIMTEWQINV